MLWVNVGGPHNVDEVTIEFCWCVAFGCTENEAFGREGQHVWTCLSGLWDSRVGVPLF